MVCRGCGDKNKNRHQQIQGDIDRNPAPPPGARSMTAEGFKDSPAPDQQPLQGDPLSAFFSAHNLSYEELSSKLEFQQKAMKRNSDHLMENMTEPMRRVHVEELVAAANAEPYSIPGMSPDHAVINLKNVLERDDFSFIHDIYPSLKKNVDLRFEEIKSRRIPLEKK